MTCSTDAARPVVQNAGSHETGSMKHELSHKKGFLNQLQLLQGFLCLTVVHSHELDI